MDMCYFTRPGGMSICVMVEGDRDDAGNLTACHDMTVTFRKAYARGFRPIGGTFCPSCIRERRYWIPPERWEAVNRKYCLGTLNI